MKKLSIITIIIISLIAITCIASVAMPGKICRAAGSDGNATTDNWSDAGANKNQNNNNVSGNPGEFRNPIPDVTTVQGLVGKISDWLTGIVAGIAVIMIMVGGLMYVIHSGNAAEAQKARNYIKYSVTGLALVIGANLIITEINYLLGNGNAVSEFSSFIGRLIDWLIVIIAGLAVIFLMYAGYTFITGGEKGVTQAKDMIKYTIIGLIVALLSYALVNWIVLTFAT